MGQQLSDTMPCIEGWSMQTSAFVSGCCVFIKFIRFSNLPSSTFEYCATTDLGQSLLKPQAGKQQIYQILRSLLSLVIEMKISNPHSFSYVGDLALLLLKGKS